MTYQTKQKTLSEFNSGHKNIDLKELWQKIKKKYDIFLTFLKKIPTEFFISYMVTCIYILATHPYMTLCWVIFSYLPLHSNMVRNDGKKSGTMGIKSRTTWKIRDANDCDDDDEWRQRYRQMHDVDNDNNEWWQWKRRVLPTLNLLTEKQSIEKKSEKIGNATENWNREKGQRLWDPPLK